MIAEKNQLKKAEKNFITFQEYIFFKLVFYLQSHICYYPYFFFFFLRVLLFIFTYLFLAVLGFCYCVWTCSSCREQGAPFHCCVRASSVAEHRFECGLSSCGAWAQLLCGMWNLPRPEIKRISSCTGRWIPVHCTPGKSSRVHILFTVNTNYPFKLSLQGGCRQYVSCPSIFSQQFRSFGWKQQKPTGPNS